MAGGLRSLQSYDRAFDTPEKVGLGDGRIVEALGVGNVRVKMVFKLSDCKKAVMYNVYSIPKLVCNLFAVRAATSKGRSRCCTRGRTGKLSACMAWGHWLYQLDCKPVIREQAADSEYESLMKNELGSL